MLNTPFSPWPSFTPEEADAVHRVVMSNRVNYWTGTETREFEKEFAGWCHTAHAVIHATSIPSPANRPGSGRRDKIDGIVDRSRPIVPYATMLATVDRLRGTP